MTTPPDAASSPFAVLVVCTANLCRSPMAEHLLRARMQAAGLTWVVSSAGLRAQSAHPMHPLAERVLRSRGVVVDGWLSSAVSEATVMNSDLILTATGEQRGQVCQLAPSVRTHTFTLLELARLTAAAGREARPPAVELGPWLVESVPAMRSRLQPAPPGEHDIPDPIGRGLKHFARCAALIDQALGGILSAPDPDRRPSSARRRGRWSWA